MLGDMHRHNWFVYKCTILLGSAKWKANVTRWFDKLLHYNTGMTMCVLSIMNDYTLLFDGWESCYIGYADNITALCHNQISTAAI